MKYDKLRIKELKEIAKEKGIKGYSGLNKSELIILLKNNKRTNKKVLKGGFLGIPCVTGHNIEGVEALWNQGSRWCSYVCKKCGQEQAYPSDSGKCPND